MTVDVLGLTGSTIDQVRFDQCVDAGGFGLVYRGKHLGIDEVVAIKCLRVQGLNSDDVELRESIAGRFRDETKLLYRLSQGNLDIVRCIGGGLLVAPTTGENTPYMVLEWLEGKPLSTELRERRENGDGGRSLHFALDLLDPAAQALAYAHSQGIVHRDVKPGNLFLADGREGTRIKVLDFGLAKILSDETLGVRASVETMSGVHFCSPSYGAPEQFSAKAGKIGPWTDVYSLSLVFLEILLGHKVRPASSLAEGLLKALDPVTGSPSATALGLKLPREIEALLIRALAQNPLERPGDAGVFWSALRDCAKNASKNAATAYDADVDAAMEKVRALQIAMAPTNKEQPSPMLQPSPFTGTMLMPNAPLGAPHLRGPQTGPPPGVPPSMSPPVGPRVQSAAPPPAPGAVPPGTAVVAPMSPLAASMVPTQTQPQGSSAPPPPGMSSGPPQGPPPVILNAPPPPQPAQPTQLLAQAPIVQQPSSSPPRRPSTDPSRTTDPTRSRPTPPPPEKSNFGAVLLLLVLTAIGVGGVGYWFMHR